ncbi:MAG: HIT domain-containing protein, partial [Mycobacteriaceae bacterium]
PVLMAELMADAVRVAEQEGLMEGGYRLLTNTGHDAGQTVHHMHVHVLGGGPLGAMTGSVITTAG